MLRSLRVLEQLISSGRVVSCAVVRMSGCVEVCSHRYGPNVRCGAVRCAISQSIMVRRLTRDAPSEPPNRHRKVPRRQRIGRTKGKAFRHVERNDCSWVASFGPPLSNALRFHAEDRGVEHFVRLQCFSPSGTPLRIDQQHLFLSVLAFCPNPATATE